MMPEPRTFGWREPRSPGREETREHQMLGHVGLQFQLEQADGSPLPRSPHEQQQVVEFLDEYRECVDIGIAHTALRGVSFELIDEFVGVVDAGPQGAGDFAHQSARLRARGIDPSRGLAPGVEAPVTGVPDHVASQIVETGLETVRALDQTAKLFEQTGPGAQSGSTGVYVKPSPS